MKTGDVCEMEFYELWKCTWYDLELFVVGIFFFALVMCPASSYRFMKGDTKDAENFEDFQVCTRDVSS